MSLEAEITSWSANPQCLEIFVRIKLWNKFSRYRREWTNVPNSYASYWVWLDGGKDSGLTNQVKTELSEILDTLVLNHETLNLFCIKYGIEEE